MASSVIVFGMRCDFADVVLEKLTLNGHHIRALVTPGSRDHSAPISDVTTSIAGTARSGLPIAHTGAATPPPRTTAVPTLELNDPSRPEALRRLADLEAEVAVVCCYPRKLPPRIVDAAKFGGLNVHPSLLPRYRGPDPLFWIYRNGETRTGVTVHQVDSGLDSGPIVRQETIDLPIGLPGDQLWRQSAEIGGDLVSESIDLIVSRSFTPVEQDHSLASYYSWPAGNDLMIDPAQWEAWRLYHFLRGILPFGFMPRLVQDGTVRRVIAALDYADHSRSHDSSVRWAEPIQCHGGSVLLELGPAIF